MDIIRHDTHFHLDLYKNIDEIVDEIENRKIYTIAVTNLPVLYGKLEKRIRSKYIRIALGFHPELVSEYNQYISQMWDLIGDTKYIGEVGLDLKKKTKKDCQKQIEFFEKLIALCHTLGDKIISVHTRGSEKEVFSIIGNKFNGRVILHWYSGSLQLLEKAINNGFYFSINISMLKSSKGKNIISRIPNDKILLESDAPFIKIDKKTYQPSDLEKIIAELAIVKNMSSSEVDGLLTHNFKRLLI